MSRHHRRNPAHAGKGLAIGLALVGGYMLYRHVQSTPPGAAPVSGLAGLGFSFGHTIRNVAQTVARATVAPIQSVARAAAIPVVGTVRLAQGVARGDSASQLWAGAKGQATSVVKPYITMAQSASPGRILNKQGQGAAPAAAAAPGAVVYEDANGNVITQDQYNQIMAQAQQQAAATGTTAPTATVTQTSTGTVQQAPVAATSVPIDPTTGQPYPSTGATPGMGPGGGYSDPGSYYGQGASQSPGSIDPNTGLPMDPNAQGAQAPDQSQTPGGQDPNAAPPPAKKGVNPLVVAGAVVGVPVFMHFFGNK